MGKPEGTRLTGARAYATGDGVWTCMAQKTTSAKPGTFTFTTGMLGADQPRTAWNVNPLYTCSPSLTDPLCAPEVPPDTAIVSSAHKPYGLFIGTVAAAFVAYFSVALRRLPRN